MNIEDLIKLSDVMSEHSLGPNGGKISETTPLHTFATIVCRYCF